MYTHTHISLWFSLTDCSVTNFMITNSVYCPDYHQPDFDRPFLVLKATDCQHTLSDGREPDPSETIYHWLLWTRVVPIVQLLQLMPWNPARLLLALSTFFSVNTEVNLSSACSTPISTIFILGCYAHNYLSSICQGSTLRTPEGGWNLSIIGLFSVSGSVFHRASQNV